MVCHAVHRGDTASAIARRLTGRAQNRHEPWFQIYDPGAARFIPKRAYERIQPGWQACIAQQAPAYAPEAAPTHVARSLHGQPAGPLAVLTLMGVQGWWWLAFLCAGATLMWTLAQNHGSRRQATVRALEQFGRTFVREFERPLMQQRSGASPVQAKLHIPHGRRLEIHLAPSAGYRYPNLSDHRQNVEYDIQRVVAVVSDLRFTSGEPVARGRWVIIPFHFDAGVDKEHVA